MTTTTPTRWCCLAQDLPALTRHEEHDWKDVDCVFCCLPHATTQEIISQLPEHLKAREEWESGSVGRRDGRSNGQPCDPSSPTIFSTRRVQRGRQRERERGGRERRQGPRETRTHDLEIIEAADAEARCSDTHSVRVGDGFFLLIDAARHVPNSWPLLVPICDNLVERECIEGGLSSPGLRIYLMSCPFSPLTLVGADCRPLRGFQTQGRRDVRQGELRGGAGS